MYDSAAWQTTSRPVEEVTSAGGDGVGALRGLDARPPADRHEPVKVPLFCEVRRLLKGVRRGLDPRLVPDLYLDTLGLDQLLDARRYTSLNNTRVRDDHHPVHAQAVDLPPNLFRGSWSIL